MIKTKGGGEEKIPCYERCRVTPRWSYPRWGTLGHVLVLGLRTVDQHRTSPGRWQGRTKCRRTDGPSNRGVESQLLKVVKPMDSLQTLLRREQSRTEKISSCKCEYHGMNRGGEHRVFCCIQYPIGSGVSVSVMYWNEWEWRSTMREHGVGGNPKKWVCEYIPSDPETATHHPNKSEILYHF